MSARRAVGAAIGVAALLAVWTAASAHQPELTLPSPAETGRALARLARDGVLLPALATTIGRALSGVVLALVVGIVWGAVAGRSEWASAIGRPALAMLMAVPPVVVVALGLVWFGPHGSVVRFVVLLVALPLIVIAVQEAVRDVDADLIEMAAAFELPRRSVLRHVIAPGVASPVMAATSVTVGQALRVAVMAELLATSDGVGALVGRSRANLDTAQLFAWAILLVAVVIVVETLVLAPLTRRLLRWRGGSGHRPPGVRPPGPAVAGDADPWSGRGSRALGLRRWWR